MSDPTDHGLKRRLKNFFLDLDARIDSGLFHAGRWARELYERYSAWMDGWHVAGWKRWLLIEPISEAATWGTAGLIILLALAIPAFRDTTDEDWLKKSELAVMFLDRYGNEVGARGIKHNDAIPLDEFPDHLIKAVLATEDRRFYEHFGIDVPGTFRAMLTNARAGGVVQGGSSITQQLAKNLFLSNERTIERKVKEAFLAMFLETRLPKNDIFKLYLDRAYLGGGTFGVDAAAQYYFNKSAREVTLAESAMLAGLFKAPTRFAPHINLPAARARANVVLDNLVEAGMMTEGQVFGARRNPANVIDRRDERSPNYYLDWAFDDIRKLVDNLPKSVTERVFIVRTGLDPNLQRHAENVVENLLRQYGPQYKAKQSALVVMDNDGTVRAMVGGRDYGVSQFNRATDALRQPGSSFKPYVYAAALMAGYKPTTIVVDGPICIGNWCPKNYSGGYSGSVPLVNALMRSLNTVAVRLSVTPIGAGNPKAGRNKIVALAKAMGLRTPLIDTPSLPIGADEVTVIDHAGAFTTFPNGGRPAKPHAALEVRTAQGQAVWRADRDLKLGRQVMPPQVAADMNMMLNRAVEEGTGRRTIIPGVKTAGKTGTTNAYRDAWFNGFSGNMTAAVWVGNDDYAPTNRMTGGSLPGMIWQQVMAFAHQGVDLKPMPGVPASQNQPMVAARAGDPNRADYVAPPSLLTRKGADVLVRIERSLEDAAKALATKPVPSASPARDRSAEQRGPATIGGGALAAGEAAGRAAARN